MDNSISAFLLLDVLLTPKPYNWKKRETEKRTASSSSVAGVGSGGDRASYLLATTRCPSTTRYPERRNQYVLLSTRRGLFRWSDSMREITQGMITSMENVWPIIWVVSPNKMQLRREFSKIWIFSKHFLKIWVIQIKCFEPNIYQYLEYL